MARAPVSKFGHGRRDLPSRSPNVPICWKFSSALAFFVCFNPACPRQLGSKLGSNGLALFLSARMVMGHS